MKKIFACLLVAIMLCSLCACGSSTTSTPAASTSTSTSTTTATSAEEAPDETDDFGPIELSFATSFATTHAFYPCLETWAQRVEEVTDGKIHVELYPSNTLVAATDMHSACVTGVVDVIETDTSYDVAAFPLSSLVYLPNLGFSSSVPATYAFNEFFHEDFAEFEGMKILLAYGMTPYAILTNKPIESLDDMADLQIRASGFGTDAMTALGAAPVSMPITEVYDAAQKGTIEAICNSYEVLKGWNFADVVQYGLLCPILPTGNHYMAMNIDVWNSIPAKYQEAIEGVNEEVLAMMAPVFDTIDQEGYEYGLEKGIVFSELSDEELATWSAKLDPVVAQWISDREAKGYDAQGAYDKLMEIVAKYQEMYP
jgi:TRAP-type C4-dicarboxylate transport system substrate-binding protein